MDDPKMLDVVMFALEEKGPQRGKEAAGTLVKFWRLPENLTARMYGRFSGPHQDFLLGMAPRMNKRIVERTRRKPAYVVMEPSLGNKVRVTEINEKGEFVPRMTEELSVDVNSWPVKADAMSGNLLPSSDGKQTRFTAAHAKYFKDLAVRHYRHGTMKDLDDECSEAIYLDEVEKNIDKLVGKIIVWEMRPYIKTLTGAASGVDDFRMQLIDGIPGWADESTTESEDEGKAEETPKGFPSEPVKGKGKA